MMTCWSKCRPLNRSVCSSLLPQLVHVCQLRCSAMEQVQIYSGFVASLSRLVRFWHVERRLGTVHLENIITEWNQQIDYTEVTTLRGRYKRDARNLKELV